MFSDGELRQCQADRRAQGRFIQISQREVSWRFFAAALRRIAFVS